ncbi:hypothetical protein [Clostridium sp.]|uniref:hypothetical protein n=1 Tax=Clostridium sp. TaxID=1506 RepID=UPI0026078A8B|nr:hypothetical protein [Clostridium sp.]
MSCLNKSDSKSQDKSNIYTVYIRDIFVIRNVGCIADGVVEGAAIRVGDDVNIIDANGNRLRSKVMKIENPVEGSIDIAPAGYAVGILLENII